MPSIQKTVAGAICAATVESKLKVFHSFFACTQGSVGTGISDTIRCLFYIKRFFNL